MKPVAKIQTKTNHTIRRSTHEAQFPKRERDTSSRLQSAKELSEESCLVLVSVDKCYDVNDLSGGKKDQTLGVGQEIPPLMAVNRIIYSRKGVWCKLKNRKENKLQSISPTLKRGGWIFQLWGCFDYSGVGTPALNWLHTTPSLRDMLYLLVCMCVEEDSHCSSRMTPSTRPSLQKLLEEQRRPMSPDCRRLSSSLTLTPFNIYEGTLRRCCGITRGFLKHCQIMLWLHWFCINLWNP